MIKCRNKEKNPARNLVTVTPFAQVVFIIAAYCALCSCLANFG